MKARDKFVEHPTGSMKLCLACDKLMLSTGKAHRICDPCRKLNANAPPHFFKTRFGKEIRVGD